MWWVAAKLTDRAYFHNRNAFESQTLHDPALVEGRGRRRSRRADQPGKRLGFGPQVGFGGSIGLASKQEVGTRPREHEGQGDGGQDGEEDAAAHSGQSSR